jgi:CHAT domain-containing protein
LGSAYYPGPPQGGRGRIKLASLLYRGASIANVDEIRKLPRLPDTADELRAVARALGQSESQIFVGEKATEGRVKASNLMPFRVLSFATHGLVAGELSGLQEPALVLTPPDIGSEQDDGLLTASEVAQLRLNAEWVVLSACNTAAGDKPDGEGLSGLAKAFFYAGTRALLVSHWPVSSDATVRLITSTFEELAARPEIGRSEALRRTMLGMLADEASPHFAHPAFWAPFVVVGEGGRPVVH